MHMYIVTKMHAGWNTWSIVNWHTGDVCYQEPKDLKQVTGGGVNARKKMQSQGYI